MSGQAGNTKIFRFGVFELDSSNFDLRRDGRIEPRLRQQTLLVLLMLLERPSEVVSREEFQKRLWSSDTFVDFDHGLNTAMNQLRGALGDSAASPRFIQTLPRRGYRFIAPVEIRDGASPAALPPIVASDDTSASRSSLLSEPHELPSASNATVRILFSAIQALYLSFYVLSLVRLKALDAVLSESHYPARLILIAVIVSAAAAIPLRLYLFSASSFGYQGLSRKFLRLFPFLFPLDELWALSPFFIVDQIGLGAAIAATAALLYLPFAQRSLLLMPPRSAA